LLTSLCCCVHSNGSQYKQQKRAQKDERRGDEMGEEIGGQACCFAAVEESILSLL
jgi:hypothetical protein